MTRKFPHEQTLPALKRTITLLLTTFSKKSSFTFQSVISASRPKAFEIRVISSGVEQEKERGEVDGRRSREEEEKKWISKATE